MMIEGVARMSVVKSKTVKSAAEAASTVRDSVEQGFLAGTEAATRTYEQAAAMTKEQFEKASVTLFKSYEELSQLGKENIDAFVKSGTIVAKGFEDMGKIWMAFTQRSLESSVETAKAAIACKTIREVVDLQSDFARQSFDSMVAEGTKIGEISVKVANEAIQPLQGRVNVVVEKILKPLAA
jgi:phasin family protein